MYATLADRAASQDSPDHRCQSPLPRHTADTPEQRPRPHLRVGPASSTRLSTDSPGPYHHQGSTYTSGAHEHADTPTHDTPELRPRGKRPESLADSLGSTSISTPPTIPLPSLARTRVGRHPTPTINPHPNNAVFASASPLVLPIDESAAELRERELRTKTVGFFLAKIALTLDEGIKSFHFADKRNWGPDEFEQLRALESCLDEAKKDFQELPHLLNGPHYYPNDRTRASLVELANIHDRLEEHMEIFRIWTRDGGPISPFWINDTKRIAHDLHIAQCHVARRIFESKNETTSRCLGAFLVHRQQRAWTGRREDPSDPAYQRHCLQEIAVCNTVGRFERFGDRDVAFVCNFCDGYVIWEDLEDMPSKRSLIDGPTSGLSGVDMAGERESSGSSLAHHRTRNGSDSSTTGAAPETPLVAPTGQPHWQATGFSVSEHEEKTIVFAAVAVASHVAPVGVEWQARHVCRYCEEAFEGELRIAQGEDDLEPVANEVGGGFGDLKEFQEHLEWSHTAYGMEMPGVLPKGTESCVMM